MPNMLRVSCLIQVALSILQGGLGIKERAKGYPHFLGGGW